MAALLTLRDVATELGVTLRTAREIALSGELRHIAGIGRGLGIRVRREWLDEFLRAREVSGSASPKEARRRERETPEANCHIRNGKPPATFQSAKEARVALGLVRGGKS